MVDYTSIEFVKIENISSEDEDMSMDYLPDTPDGEESNPSTHTTLPAASLAKYNMVYNYFQTWRMKNGSTPVSETVLMKYFTQMAERSKPTTLWAYYSMLKNTLRINDNIDISSYSTLLGFLKKQSAGYTPARAKIFTRNEIEKFINEAPDENWLDLKVVCIFALNGVNKFTSVKVKHIKQYEDMYLVTIPKIRTNCNSTFVITGKFFSVVQKYAALRPPHATDDRFFLNYRGGKCTVQVIGKNKFTTMPRKIANYLQLPELERYTGYSFRINTSEIMTHTGICATDGRSVQNVIQRVESSLNYQTAQDKDLSVSHTPQMPVIASVASNYYNGSASNYWSGHVCTISCGQVKCATEENEVSVLHAFTLMKPPEYDIAEVIPAQFSSEPCCRWVVHYTHITDPVSAIDLDQKFEDITRSIPNNVKVNQTYVSVNSSQRSAAYVVVYSVNCRCQKKSSNLVCVHFDNELNKIKSET